MINLAKPNLIIGAANVICGKATWSLLIKTAFGRFNQLVFITDNKLDIAQIIIKPVFQNYNSNFSKY